MNTPLMAVAAGIIGRRSEEPNGQVNHSTTIDPPLPKVRKPVSPEKSRADAIVALHVATIVVVVLSTAGCLVLNQLHTTYLIVGSSVIVVACAFKIWQAKCTRL